MNSKSMTSTLIACIAVCLVAIIAMTVVLINGMNNNDTSSVDSSGTSTIDTADTSSQDSSSLISSSDASSTQSQTPSDVNSSKESSSSVTSSDKTNSVSSLPNPDDDPFIDNTPEGERICYLTFDDGPNANTDKVLSILKQNDIKATFFVVGYLSTDKIKNVYNDGHAIGLHTYSHDLDKLYASTGAFMSDLAAISDVVYNKTGIRSNLTRFPGGSGTAVTSKRLGPDGFETVKQTLKEQGYTYFDWNIDSGDTHKGTSKDYIVNQVRKGIKTDSGYKSEVCVLLHDIKDVTVKALPEVIQVLKDAGYTFKTLDSKCNNFAFK